MRSAAVTSRANPHLKQLRAAFTGNPRLSGGLIAIEGEHLLMEALRSNIAVEQVFLSTGAAPPAELPRNIPVLSLDLSLLRSAVDTLSPQGIAALVRPPDWSLA